MSDDTILIRHGYVITMNSRREIIRDGAVFIEGSRIVEVCKTDELTRREADTVIDAEGMIVLPGLIDTHVHLAQALIRGCADDVSLVDWLKRYVWVLQGNFTEEDGRVAAELCMAEMIKTGTTSFIECMIHTRYGFNGIAETVKRVGMRTALSKIVMDAEGYADSPDIMYPGMVENADDCLREADAMIRRWHGAADGRIQVWYGLRSLGAVSPALFREVASLARQKNTHMTMHLGEVIDDVRAVHAMGYPSLTDFAREMGLLGPDMVFAHGVYFEHSELPILANTHTNIAHCPSSNAKLASGIAKVPAMLQLGVPLSLGCDGGPSNNTYDMFREMRVATLIHKAITHDPTTPRAEQVLELATIGGAHAMGIQNIGRIQTDALADIILVSTHYLGLNPVLNPLSNIVYAGSGRDVDTVIVNGRILMLHQHLLTIDEQAIIEQANTRATELLHRTGIDVQPHWPVR